MKTQRMKLLSLLFFSVLFCYSTLVFSANKLPTSTRSTEVAKRVSPKIQKKLKEKGFTLGAPVLMRIFKETSELEVWLQAGNEYALFKSYKICYFSGNLGPKTKVGDLQSPEGFYTVTPKQFNPSSRFHLAFNLGYPNAYDRAYQRTGDALMVHGNCVSIGCYAMTDNQIEEIYTIAAAALEAGQPAFQVQALPFRLSDENLAAHKNSPWLSFWQNLKVGYDYFEQHKKPPKISVKNKQYVFEK
ncbi:MAG TPA: murein L,D-transpeptidase family protein [Methylotenera sp.]|nr:murein L,D-transpeptidase family protein [Methylotenera sp.]HPH06273.1 murein L,D-transpeptidase family protein [Methylotenera sp.]HPN00381.1 murein L,D-transpeptidase family protein [Methylotenera sp.]